MLNQCFNYMNESSCRALSITDSHLYRICCSSSGIIPDEYMGWSFFIFAIISLGLMVYAFYYIATHPADNGSAEKKNGNDTNR